MDDKSTGIPALTTDELFAQMEQDELEDRIAEQSKASPIEYAKTHGIKPQMVYYWIRTGKLKKEMCVCGRSVIDIAEADAVREPPDPYVEPEMAEEEEA
jgi:hypothetical protein